VEGNVSPAFAALRRSSGSMATTLTPLVHENASDAESTTLAEPTAMVFGIFGLAEISGTRHRTCAARGGARNVPIPVPPGTVPGHGRGPVRS